MSTVKRWAFTICDCCCEQLNIEMKEGIHYPKKVIVDAEEIAASLESQFNQLAIDNISIKSMTGVSSTKRNYIY